MDNIYKGNGFKNTDDDSKEFDFPIFKVLISIFIIVSVYNFFSFDNTVLRNVDMEPFSEPIQQNIKNGDSFQYKTSEGIATVTPIAEYKIYGRVLARHYRPSKLPVASMYPYDVTIGFGDFRYKEVFKAIKVKMASTISYWSCSGSAWQKIQAKYFKQNSIDHCWTNNHLCPANKNIKRGISKLKKKDIVYIEGYLVKYELRKKDGNIERGISSTVRNDHESFSGNNGSGSCEQIYVTRIVSRHGDFR